MKCQQQYVIVCLKSELDQMKICKQVLWDCWQ